VDGDQPHITDFRHENRDNSDVIMAKSRDMNFQPARLDTSERGLLPYGNGAAIGAGRR
jgi:hypothetical protein